MSILVTGASGNVGSLAAKILLEKNHKISLLSRGEKSKAKILENFSNVSERAQKSFFLVFTETPTNFLATRKYQDHRRRSQ